MRNLKIFFNFIFPNKHANNTIYRTLTHAITAVGKKVTVVTFKNKCRHSYNYYMQEVYKWEKVVNEQHEQNVGRQ